MLLTRSSKHAVRALLAAGLATFTILSVLSFRYWPLSRSKAVNINNNNWGNSNSDSINNTSGKKLPVIDLIREAKRFQKMADRLEELGILFSRDSQGWHKEDCDVRRDFRPVTLPSVFGNLTLYVYGSEAEDRSVTLRALKGQVFEEKEIRRFLEISNPLPLIDIGANVGLVTLQAAMQGRPVFGVEPIAENALRLCRSAVDFGHADLVHVIHNAVSSLEGTVTLETMSGHESTLFTVKERKTAGKFFVDSYAILLDRLLEVLPFSKVALKIDVESHEGHVIEGAERMFRELDVPIVWMEWEHVKQLSEHGARTVLDFMSAHHMRPYDLMTLSPLALDDFTHWPFTVLWLREGISVKRKNGKTHVSGT